MIPSLGDRGETVLTPGVFWLPVSLGHAAGDVACRFGFSGFVCRGVYTGTGQSGVISLTGAVVVEEECEFVGILIALCRDYWIALLRGGFGSRRKLLCNKRTYK